MENPFVYGEVVPTGAFIDRVVELDRLVGDLAAGQKVFLISPRRYGKSSLIRQALAAVARRGAVQHQRDVGSVFACSEPSLMERMLGPKRPFYKAGPVMRLEKIPADEFAAALDSRFRRSGMKPEEGLGDAIVELAGNLPYDVQRLAHETWDEVRASGGKRAALDLLHQALGRLLSEQETMFEALWQRLTLPQRAVLRAVVIESGHSVLSEDVRNRHRLGRPSM